MVYRLLIFGMWVTLVLGQKGGKGDNIVEITILHTNDIDAKIEQVDETLMKCTEDKARNGLCWGGYARLISKIKEIRARDKNVLLMDAGEQQVGTLMYNIHKYRVTSYFMNLAGYDVAALGNNDFDFGLDNVVSFLRDVNFPVVNCNINITKEPLMKDLFVKSIILTLSDGVKVGVIGYINQEYPLPGELEYENLLTSINNQAKALKDARVTAIIALGDANLRLDEQIAKKVGNIDLIVGGDSGKFLWPGNESPPSIEEPKESYPYIVRKQVGKGTVEIPIVSVPAGGKYLGEIKLKFNGGKLEQYSGRPIPLDYSVPQDPDILRLIEEWKIKQDSVQTIGRTAVFLEGGSPTCRIRECTLGNLITDAAIQENIWAADGDEWNQVAVALFNSGAIRTSIDEKNLEVRLSVVTAGQLLEALPFGNVFDKVKLRGDVIKEVMEHSVSNYDMETPSGIFLQVSGMRVKYDMQQPVGSRVVEIQVRCTRCKDPMVPTYEPIWPGRPYWIITNRFLAEGGDGYTMLRDKQLDKFNTGNHVTVDVANYIRRVSPVTQGIEGRIMFMDRSANCNDFQQTQQIANPQSQVFARGKMPVRTHGRRPGRPYLKPKWERRPALTWKLDRD